MVRGLLHLKAQRRHVGEEARAHPIVRPHAFFQRVRFADIAGRAEDREQPRGLERLPLFIPPVLELRDPAQAMLPLPPVRPPELEGLESLPTEGDLPRMGGAQPRSSIRTLSEILADGSAPLSLIIGGPGTGKTELGLWLMAKLCTPGESIPELRPDVVPVRIELRRYDADCSREGASYDFFAHVAQTLPESTPKLDIDQLKTLGRQGRLLWIFDGMDEVRPVSRRQRYAEQVVNLLRSYPGRALITCRTVGCEDLLEALGICPVYALRDFDDAQIDAFLENWHRLAFAEDAEKGELRRRRLAHAIKQSSGLRELCRNPLLLTLLALLNRGDELPRRRHKIFERALDLLVAQWEANKDLLPADTHAEFEREDKLLFLRKLAWAMQNNSWPDSRNNLIQRDALQAFTACFFQSHFDQDEDRAQARARALIADLEDRNGILVFLGGDQYGFVHKTFLEYLAAEEFVRSLSPDKRLARITESVHDESWLEILTLACGLLDDRGCTDQVLRAVQEVLRNLDLSFGGRAWRASGYAFCIRCLAEVRHLQKEPMRRLTDGLMRILQQDALAMEPKGWVWHGDEIVEALRFFGPRWPTPDGWQRWAQRPEWQRERPGEDNYSWTQQCVLASAKLEERMGLVVALLENESNHGHARAVLDEAALLGPWSLDEVLTLASRLAPAHESVHMELGDHFAHQVGGDVLHSLLRAHLHDRIRFHLAVGVRLTRDSSVSELAKQVFLELTRSSFPVIRYRACCVLSLHVSECIEVQERLEQLLDEDPDKAVRLVAGLALLGTDLRERARSQLLSLHDVCDPEPVLLLAQYLARQDVERDLARTLWLRLLNWESEHIPGAALIVLIRQFWDDHVKVHVLRKLTESVATSLFQARSLAVALFEIQDEEINLAALQALVSICSAERRPMLPGGYLQKYPERVRWLTERLRTFLADATDECRQLQIARCLRSIRQEGVVSRELLQLAHAASREEVRLAAAVELHDAARVLELARSAENVAIRVDALEYLFYWTANGDNPWLPYILEIVENDSSEQVRWFAAARLLDNQMLPEAKEAAKRIAKSLISVATDEAIRCEVAVALADRSILIQLSTSALDAVVRHRASGVLAWLDLRAEVLQLAPGSALT